MTETLKDLLEKAKERHGVTSGRALADLTDGRKNSIDRTQVNALLKGTYKSELRPSTIRAIAWLAGVDYDRAFRAADQKIPGPPFAEELPPRSDYLSDTQRRAVITVIRAFLGSAEEEGGQADGTAAPTKDPGSGPGLRVVPEAAYGTSGETRGQQQRGKIDKAGEESQERPGTNEGS